MLETQSCENKTILELKKHSDIGGMPSKKIPAIVRLPKTLKETIIHMLYEEMRYSDSTLVFPEEMAEWSQILLRLESSYKAVCPILDFEKVVQDKNRELTSQLSIISTSWHTTPLLGNDSVDGKLVELLKLGWPNVRRLEILYRKNFDFEKILSLVNWCLPKTMTIKVKIASEEAAEFIKQVYLNSPRVRHLKLVPMQNIRPTKRTTVYSNADSVNQKLISVLEGCPNWLMSLDLICSFSCPELLATIQRTQSHMQLLSLCANVDTFGIMDPSIPLNITSLDIFLLCVTSISDKLAFDTRCFPILSELHIRETRSISDTPVVPPPRLFENIFMYEWKSIRLLTMPRISDAIAIKISKNCPGLQTLNIVTDPFLKHSILRSSDVDSSESEGNYTDSDNDFSQFTNRGLEAITKRLINMKEIVIGGKYSDIEHELSLPYSQQSLEHNNLNGQISVVNRFSKWNCANLKTLEIYKWNIDLKSVGYLLHQLPLLREFYLELRQDCSPSDLSKWPERHSLTFITIDIYGYEDFTINIINDMLKRLPDLKRMDIYNTPHNTAIREKLVRAYSNINIKFMI
ncbi:hypothetical protein H4219_000075 [Mycoemilia scoparia]|uniref:Uncharacterized protein n=1 Tax=Mycoemilia scoparia TaxID=417184 RepID=A0A9W8A3R0_9FUNG|nr:hypothetical protein H4219_000075 [Mycoemilia scoparia]